MIKFLSNLNKSGVIGINERNIRYVNANNQRKLLKRVDDKLETKTLAAAAGIPAPELFGVVRDARDMRRIEEFMAHPEGCAVKPALGSQGKGILVVAGPIKNGWRLMNGKRICRDAMRFHVNNILSGMYSLSGQPDKALIESRVQFDDAFDKISFKGVPDIRIIVVKGVPAAAMVRLPTSDSDGKANLHRGGVGVGLDIATGVTQRGMQFGARVDVHPDTAESLAGLVVPHWDRMLEMAAQSYDVTGLGYIGVDLVLDKTHGPLLLELNGRPGLSIQIANEGGLRRRLDDAARLADMLSGAPANVRAAAAKALCADDAPLAAPFPPQWALPPVNAESASSVVPFPTKPVAREGAAGDETPAQDGDAGAASTVARKAGAR